MNGKAGKKEISDIPMDNRTEADRKIETKRHFRDKQTETDKLTDVRERLTDK